MDQTDIAPGFAVTGQLAVTDISEIAEKGFRAIICNRPDGEDPEQPGFARIAAAARAAGLETRYVPVAGSGATGADDDAFDAALADLPRPVLAYCRTGRRSAMLWSRREAAKSQASS